MDCSPSAALSMEFSRQEYWWLFSLSVLSDSATPWTEAHQASLSFTISWSLLKLTSIESMMTSNHLSLCRPILLLPSIFPSIRVVSNEIALCIRWPKYWSFSFTISPSNLYSGLISFRIDWFDLLAVQGALKSHLQHVSKASNFQCSIFFIEWIAISYARGSFWPTNWTWVSWNVGRFFTIWATGEALF